MNDRDILAVIGVIFILAAIMAVVNADGTHK